MRDCNSFYFDFFRNKLTNLHTQLSRSHTSISSKNNTSSKIYITNTETNESEAVSFEGLLKENEIEDKTSISQVRFNIKFYLIK